MDTAVVRRSFAAMHNANLTLFSYRNIRWNESP